MTKMKHISVLSVLTVLVVCFVVPMAMYPCEEFFDDICISTPVAPGVRLEQDGSLQTRPAYIWDIRGNEQNFYICDVSHGWDIPFRIEAGTVGDTFCIRNTGQVGIGTWSPYYTLEVENATSNASIGIERGDGATGKMVAGQYGFQVGSVTNHPLKLIANNTVKMTIYTDGSLTMSDGGYYDGDWHPASSRAIKENIRNLDADDAVKALDGLNPVRFNYKKGNTEDRVGFIAEDVPELVAVKGRKSIGTTDIVAVLTKVVKEQQKTISQLNDRIAALEQKQ